MPVLKPFLDFSSPEFLPYLPVIESISNLSSCTTRQIRSSELLFFLSEDQQLARTSSVTRAELLSRARVVQFDRDPPANQIDRETTAMRDAEARLATFGNVRTASEQTQRGGEVELESVEIVALVVWGFYKCHEPGVFRLRCSFCKKSFPYSLSLPDAAARLVRLRRTHELSAPTCAISLNHLADDRPLDERRISCMLAGNSSQTRLLVTPPGTSESQALLCTTSAPEATTLLENSIDVTNARLLNDRAPINVQVDNEAFYFYSASTEYESLSDFEHAASQETLEWALPSVYLHKRSLIEWLTGKLSENCHVLTHTFTHVLQ